MDSFGIDFGTTNSYLARSTGNRLEVVSTQSGKRVVPSQIKENGNTLTSIKRYLGRSPEELDQLGLDYIEENGLKIPWAGQTFSPEELAALFFEHFLKETSRIPPLRAVLSVPAHYNEAQRQATKIAAENAGIEVLRLIHEPTAAALAFGRGDEEERVVVFDLGGGTLDLSLLEIGGDVFEVVQTAGNRNLGGDDLDLSLAVEISRKLDTSFTHQVLAAARQAKHDLSGLEKTLVVLPHPEDPLQVSLSRSELEKIATSFLSEIQSTLEEFRGTNPDTLLLVGGMSRMPAVIQLVSDFFGLEPVQGVDPETAVALGAARYARSLQGEDDALLLDITPMSLGIETEDIGYSVLIQKGSRIPIIKERMFSTSRDNQATVRVNILQGDHDDPSDNTQLGSVWLRGIEPAPAGIPEIWVSFQLDTNGMLHVLAVDPDRDLEEEITIGLQSSGEDCLENKDQSNL